MDDHYIACVLIVFAALLATIPTYHEMMSARTPPGTEPGPGIVAGISSEDGTGVSSEQAKAQRGSLSQVTVQPTSEVSSHAHSGAALLAIEPGTLGWTLIEGSPDVARDAAVGAIGPGVASANVRLTPSMPIVTK